jgi:HEAT repeat protein
MATWATKPFEAHVEELRAESPRTRRQAAAALQVSGDLRAVGPLLAALTDTDAGVRAVVARALGALGDRRAVAPLLTALRDAEAEVRRAAAEALWRLATC